MINQISFLFDIYIYDIEIKNKKEKYYLNKKYLR